jgi:hypothetical protein
MKEQRRTPRPLGRRLGQVGLVLLLGVSAMLGLLFSAICFPLTVWLGKRAEARGRNSRYRVVRWHLWLEVVSGASRAVLLVFPKSLRYAAQRYDSTGLVNTLRATPRED